MGTKTQCKSLFNLSLYITYHLLVTNLIRIILPKQSLKNVFRQAIYNTLFEMPHVILLFPKCQNIKL